MVKYVEFNGVLFLDQVGERFFFKFGQELDALLRSHMGLGGYT